MAASGVVPKSSSSFVYEDLVSRIQDIRNQMFKFEQILDDRCKNETNILNELKSRSLTFIDPYGNQMNDKYLDHKLINNVLKNYKKNYVPKYLQEWIQIGAINENTISSLSDFQLRSPVSNYANDYQFICYGLITVWIGGHEYAKPYPFFLKVRLTDNMEQIKTQVAELGHCTQIQLFSITPGYVQPTKNSWNEGTILKSEDSILSRQLYNGKHAILAKIGEEKVDFNF
jgi:hypothetical protein